MCGFCTRTDIVREHLEDNLRICDVSAMGLYFAVFTFTMTKILLVHEFPSSLKFFEEGLLMQLGFNPSTYFHAFQNFQSFGT